MTTAKESPLLCQSVYNFTKYPFSSSKSLHEISNSGQIDFISFKRLFTLVLC